MRSEVQRGNTVLWALVVAFTLGATGSASAQPTTAVAVGRVCGEPGAAAINVPVSLDNPVAIVRAMNFTLENVTAGNVPDELSLVSVCHGGASDGQICDPRVPNVCGDGGSCDSAACTARTAGFVCSAAQVENKINVIIVNFGTSNISGTSGPVVTLTLADSGTMCTRGVETALNLTALALADPANQPVAATAVNGSFTCGCPSDTTTTTSSTTSTSFTTSTSTSSTTSTTTSTSSSTSSTTSTSTSSTTSTSEPGETTTTSTSVTTTTSTSSSTSSTTSTSTSSTTSTSEPGETTTTSTSISTTTSTSSTTVTTTTSTSSTTVTTTTSTTATTEPVELTTTSTSETSSSTSTSETTTTSSTETSTSTTETTSTTTSTLPPTDACVAAQRDVQRVIGDGNAFKNHGQVMKRVNELLKAEDGVAEDCHACIVRQFARQIPVVDQLPCARQDSTARALLSLGADQPLSAVKILLKATNTAEKALFLSKDVAIYPPLANTLTDPTLFGATVEFCSGQGSASFDLPAHLWHMSGSGSVFKFTQTGSLAAVKVVLIKGGRTLKVVSKTVGIPLPGALGAVGVRVTTGDVRNCALFTPATIVKDEPGKYIAQRALGSAAADCTDASLGCSSSAP